MAFLIASLNLALSYWVALQVSRRYDKAWESRSNWCVEKGKIEGDLWLRTFRLASSISTLYCVLSVVIFALTLVGTGMGLLR